MAGSGPGRGTERKRKQSQAWVLCACDSVGNSAGVHTLLGLTVLGSGFLCSTLCMHACCLFWSFTIQ